MRTGELRDLKWSYIDRKEMMIRLPAEVTKEKRSKIIPINHHVKRVLESVPRALMHDFVFTYRGSPILHKQGFKLILKRTCEKAAIPYGSKDPDGIIFHDIRRTVKTNMLHAGVDKVYRDLILGHSLKGMDVHYLAPSEDSLKEAMDKYTRWMDEQIDNISADFDQK
jgi:integrase